MLRDIKCFRGCQSKRSFLAKHRDEKVVELAGLRTGQAMKNLLKWPSIVAAAVVVIRVICERSGVPESINNLLSIAFLVVLAGPLYFAIRIAREGMPHPYSTHLKATFLYAVIARAMVLPTYWLGYIYKWPQSRFGGVNGPDVPPFAGFVGVPVITGLIWVVGAMIIGGTLGCIVIALMSRFERKPLPS
jgi:hypothetical protein